MDQSYIINADIENDMNVRLIQQLRIRIGEAKKLRSKNGNNFLKDCFCVIKLDMEEIARTHCSNEKTLHPFFGEEFYFDIPRVFRFLSIYLYEREKTVNTFRNRALGKVTIGRSQLCKLSAEDTWFPLLPVNHESEVQGKINLLVEPRYSFNSNSLGLFISIYECHELTLDCCDSHVVVEFKFNEQIYTKKSKVKRKTANPQFNEQFYFELPLNQYGYADNTVVNNNPNNRQYVCHRLLMNSELRVYVMLDSCSRSNIGFLGEVRIPLNKLELNVEHRAWYLLQPRSKVINCSSNLGSLRLRINYISDHVFSSHFYDPLRNQLLSSIEIKPITSSVAFLLGEFLLNKADAAQPLVKVFLHYNKLVPLIHRLAEDEISKVTDVNTIFRGNSLVSKCIDELMKLVGIRYLHETLRQSVEKVIVENKSCEIDPVRIKICELVDCNMDHLKQYISAIFIAITGSANRCPQIMREVFFVLKELAKKFFPQNKDVCYYVISGFVFLRFFAPALLNPRLFELTDLNINAQTNRTLTLISKTIQSIGNLAVAKKSNGIIKEGYMTPLYKDFISNEAHMTKTKEFLESISSCRLFTKDISEPVILKESIMFKKSRYKRISFGSTFKKRYFCLTTQHFLYSKAKSKAPIFKLPISEISVSKISDAYHVRNMFQVSHNKCTLHIQASNCVQEKEWLDTLNRLIQLNQTNANKLHYDEDCIHPITPDLSIKLDPDREMERIHSLLATNQENMQAIIDAGDKNSSIAKLWKGPSRAHLSHFVLEDPYSLLQTVRRLKESILQLNKYHQQYTDRIYGSEDLPIDVESSCANNIELI